MRIVEQQKFHEREALAYARLGKRKASRAHALRALQLDKTRQIRREIKQEKAS